MDSRDSRDISGKKWAGLSDQKENLGSGRVQIHLFGDRSVPTPY